MSLQDSVSDMLTCIRNGQRVNKENVVFPLSRLKEKISLILQEEGFIKEYKILGEKKQKIIVYLKYFSGKPVIEKIIRVSRPSLRIYKKKDDIPTVMSGMGVAIISTSKGIMTDKNARLIGIGGEVICYIF